MNINTVKLFHELLKKGWIDREENSILWNSAEDEEARDELEQMGRELGFDIVQAQNRIYMVPTQDNDLFLKNNVDYRGDIKANSEVKSRDLYMLNYFAVFTVYTFFRGEGNDPLSRDFITKEELIKDFTEHCENVVQKGMDGEAKNEDYSDNFYLLANDWLGKKEGDPVSRRIEDRYGVVNKIMLKFRADDLFYEDGTKIRPTRKMKDLMPYVLRKDRVQMINRWIEEEANASDK